MSAPTTHRGILVGVDGSPSATVAVDWAAREAASRKVPLTLVYVLSPPVMMMWPEVAMPPSYSQWQEEQGREILAEATKVAQAAAKADGGVEVRTEMPTGPSQSVLIELSAEADLVVVGSRGRGALARGLLGSVSSNVVRHAHCPVAVIHDEDPMMDNPSQAPVVVGIDGSPASEVATSIAFDVASRRGVELVAFHAVSDADVIEIPGVDYETLEERAHVILAERLAGWQERYPDVTVRRVVEWGRPANALVKQAENAQLLVVGSHGRGGFTGMLLGSVANSVAQAAKMPVIVARKP
ncbi:universal stress protein [Mycolicibacterium chitae]|uniref:Universal stress family protein n=1 Tax=Mycolicibacterium chitae TaxID=1792 RepID=A0A3S5EIK8_MYCCI|nr:universal stress protein [Mycolicibacterium chitae]MCV7106789.1 universal stress protein [Mycolicibacterium chitae]BBZ05742.1 universal stress protein [Mycolicibacterium chitae]VEG49352.1 Universal stress family protein [Mycolicibacterium chitae]